MFHIQMWQLTFPPHRNRTGWTARQKALPRSIDRHFRTPKMPSRAALKRRRFYFRSGLRSDRVNARIVAGTNIK
jgi:hypothetical protein